MRRNERHPSTAAQRPSAASTQMRLKLLLTAGAMLLVCGCRNTTTTAPGAPLGATSPLSPYPGNPSLAPIPGTAGMGNLGQPTRVPPPPTGSYTAPTPGAPAPVSTWGNPPPGTLSPTSLPPTGSTIGSTGMTRGVTNLTPAPAGTVNGGVQQTGWVGQSPAPVGVGVPGAPPAAAPTSQAPSPTSGGMQVIDLTGAPSATAYPPSTYPPSTAPSTAYPQPTYPQPGYPQPAAPQAAPASYQQPAAYPPSIPPAGSATPAPYTGASRTPLPSTAPSNVPSTATVAQSSGNAFESAVGVQTASRPTTVAFPSTQPYPATSATESLDWRTPSPRY